MQTCVCESVRERTNVCMSLEWPACCVVFTWVWRYQSISACRRVEAQTLRHIGLAVYVGRPRLPKHFESVDGTKAVANTTMMFFIFCVPSWWCCEVTSVAMLSQGFLNLCARLILMFSFAGWWFLFICTMCVSKQHIDSMLCYPIMHLYTFNMLFLLPLNGSLGPIPAP